MGNGTSLEKKTRNKEKAVEDDEERFKIRVIYYAYGPKDANGEYEDESKFDFTTELVRGKWYEIINDDDYKKSLLGYDQTDDLKKFLRAFVIGRIKEVRCVEITRNAKDKATTDNFYLSNLFKSFSGTFNPWVIKLRSMFRNGNHIEYSHYNSSVIERVKFNGILIGDGLPVDKNSTFDPHTELFSLIDPRYDDRNIEKAKDFLQLMDENNIASDDRNRLAILGLISKMKKEQT